MKFTKVYIGLITGLLFGVTSTFCFADYFTNTASYSICFTPGSNCASAVINTIAQAKKQILVQAYSLTDLKIVKALLQAQRRGVEVNIILDKSQLRAKYPLKSLLAVKGIKVLVDYKPEIAHNKVIIVDQSIVVGGSYNYSRSANQRNAENLLIINDAGFAKHYVNNWYLRARESRLLSGFLTTP